MFCGNELLSALRKLILASVGIISATYEKKYKTGNNSPGFKVVRVPYPGILWENHSVEDLDGNLFIDWMTGISVLNLGYANFIRDAVKLELESTWPLFIFIIKIHTTN